MTAPDHMPEMFENRLHEPGHPHMEPPANPVRFRSIHLRPDLSDAGTEQLGRFWPDKGGSRYIDVART